jgi:hypothetical protein
VGWQYWGWQCFIMAWITPLFAYLALHWLDLAKKEVAHLRYRELEAVDEYLANELSLIRKKLIFQ